MNINELFTDYLDCYQEETDNQYMINLIEWLQTDDTVLFEGDSITINTGGGKQQNTPGNRDIDRPDPNMKKKSKSEEYAKHIENLMKNAGLGNAKSLIVSEASNPRLGNALKYAKKRAKERDSEKKSKSNLKKKIREVGARSKRTEGGKNRRLRELLLARRKPKNAETSKKNDEKSSSKADAVVTKKKESSGTKKKSVKKSEKGETKDNLQGNRNTPAAKRFWSYDSAAEGKRKHNAPDPPQQFGKTHGVVDGDLKGRFERYYGKKVGERIRRGVAVKIAQGRQNKSGLAKGRGKGKWRKKGK